MLSISKMLLLHTEDPLVVMMKQIGLISAISSTPDSRQQLAVNKIMKKTNGKKISLQLTPKLIKRTFQQRGNSKYNLSLLQQPSME